jgi:hypothetical protein
MFPGLRQLEVDFVVPRLVGDIPLCIDPFLLYKSRDPELRALHDRIIQHFRLGMSMLASDDQAEAERILTFPEVSEVGLGYGSKDKDGSGLGTVLRNLLIETLKASPAIMRRGIRHIEEMQLISPGIGPDRVGDIASNILKEYLINYTQRQCAIHRIPLQSGVPLQHVFDLEERIWRDGYFDLPISPHDGTPVLLVPRRIVRQLPWINYDNFIRTEFRVYLSAKSASAVKSGKVPSKAEVTSASRVETSIIDNYVRGRELQAAQALPFLPAINDETMTTGESLIRRLKNTPMGIQAAHGYQQLTLDIFTFVFYPDLIDGRLEEKTIDGTERRDVLFTNDSDSPFLEYIRNTHDSLIIMFEAKNVAELTMAALNQSAVYLGDRIGRFGCIVTRLAPEENVLRKQIAIFNDSQPRKVLLILSDADLIDLIETRMQDKSPVRWLQKRYRDFRTAVQ